MAGLLKYFQRQSLPRSEETGLGEATTEEANAAVERRVLEEERIFGVYCYLQVAFI